MKNKKTKLDTLGRIVIPAPQRHAAGIDPGLTSLRAKWEFDLPVDALGRMSMPANFRIDNQLVDGTEVAFHVDEGGTLRMVLPNETEVALRVSDKDVERNQGPGRRSTRKQIA